MIIAANWKMNLSRQNAGDLLKSYRDISADASASLITFVPACYLVASIMQKQIILLQRR